MGWYIVISVIMFFVGFVIGRNEGKSGVGDGLFLGLCWPLGIIFLFVSLFWGAGKYL